MFFFEDPNERGFVIESNSNIVFRMYSILSLKTSRRVVPVTPTGEGNLTRFLHRPGGQVTVRAPSVPEKDYPRSTVG